ncbi:uncharacterized protein DUF4291 [Kribbella antiqua]|uniref:Uncharacterized protein DUF4291 n=1 Tax=Kribbella antiqua TaxID=2512217 RepID=A0A4V2S2L7_9ACTN|nr:DUF4291 domain-containing protein [Kribbella antiqua]TCO40940.1 uncharacterized protein DUF4291 [Kribbella antiqua]
MEQTPYRQIRALYDDETIAVYQAYAPEIAEPALAAGTFVPPFGFNRMTWIKPSFLWMAYRSGWATKPGQTRVLRIHLKRAGFEWALAHSCLSHYDPAHHESEQAWRETLATSPVRIQWDPEQTLTLQPQPKIRSIQIGLSPEAVHHYVHDWITTIEDATPAMHEIHHLSQTNPTQANTLLPQERPYPLPPTLTTHIAPTPTT